MAVKDMTKGVIDSLSDEATMEDIIDARYIRAKFEYGEQEIREGKGIPHEQAKEGFRRRAGEHGRHVHNEAQQPSTK